MNAGLHDKLTLKYAKLRMTLRWRLVGEKMYTALSCLEVAEAFSLGRSEKAGIISNIDLDPQMRKDGITPEFEHQIRIALHAFTLKGVPDLEALICTILCHDLLEDYDVDKSILMGVLNTYQSPAGTSDQSITWGRTVYDAIWCMTKKYRGVNKSESQVFADIANNPLASLAKGLDRIQNFQSMPGVFKVGKRITYVEEGIYWFMPMLKKARKQFPYQTDAYLNIETVMKYQIELLQIINDTERVINMNTTSV